MQTQTAAELSERLLGLREAAERELRGNILPFWATRAVDRRRGGFHGLVTDDLRVRRAARGSVLTSRILWTFSAAYRRWPDPLYREVADHAFACLVGRFWDERHSGLVWTTSARGRILDAAKRTYALSMGIYALVEHALATGSREAFERAVRLFNDVEQHALDPEGGGYSILLTRDWGPAPELRLGMSDPPAAYGANTHLHLLEAYASLARQWEPARPRLRALIEIVLERTLDAGSGHLVPFHDAHWQPLSQAVSFGHDIEASWLLREAAAAFADRELQRRTEAAVREIAARVLEEGCDRKHGGIFGEAGRPDAAKDWWSQAEACVGFLDAFQLTGRSELALAALDTWSFIERHHVDRVQGGWHPRVTREGRSLGYPKIDLWTCPYHSGRCALEIVRRVEELVAEAIAGPRPTP